MIAEQYESQKVMSATPMELIVMLYDHAIRNLSKAVDALDMVDDLDRLQALNNHLLRAQDFIAELACSVDVERGGEMAGQLNRLYEFMLRQLTDANTEHRREPMEAVLNMLRELRDAWGQALAMVPRNERVDSVPVERSSSFSFSG